MGISCNDLYKYCLIWTYSALVTLKHIYTSQIKYYKSCIDFKIYLHKLNKMLHISMTFPNLYLGIWWVYVFFCIKKKMKKEKKKEEGNCC